VRIRVRKILSLRRKNVVIEGEEEFGFGEGEGFYGILRGFRGDHIVNGEVFYLHVRGFAFIILL
jgi:hypothetical protein